MKRPPGMTMRKQELELQIAWIKQRNYSAMDKTRATRVALKHFTPGDY